MDDGFLTKQELQKMGFKKFGQNLKLSRKASYYMCDKISIGNNVRIDDFCILIGNITIHDYVHIGAYCGLHASLGSIVFRDFSCISSNVTIYSSTDDYSGNSMTNAVIDRHYTNISYADVIIDRFSIVGTGSTILQNAIISEGVSVGAMSLVNKKLEPWKIYAGVPCKVIKDKIKKPLEIYQDFLRTQKL